MPNKVPKRIDTTNPEKGIFFKMEVGPLYFEKELYRPTLERFDKWYEIMKERPWFKEFEFLIWGSFPNIIKNSPTKWPTWDVDIVMHSKYDPKDNLKIRNCLIECSFAALNTCDFFMDIYYQDTNEVKRVCEEWNKIEAEIIGGDDTRWHKRSNEYFLLQYAEYVKRNGNIVTNWNIGSKLMDGLWENTIYFPSKKQVTRIRDGKVYEKAIKLSEYEDIRNNASQYL